MSTFSDSTGDPWNGGKQGREAPGNLPDDCDLLLSGVVDSLGMLEWIAAFQEHCGCEIDFESLDPELMTVVGPLGDFVAAQIVRE